ncbi:thioesterase II family protein [Rheinheimera gaetbuli]
MKTDSTANWLGANFKPEKGKVLLFCFPYAGGGSQFYAKWHSLLEPKVQVCPVFLPGRERRIREPLRSDMMALIDELVEQIAPFTGQPYALFGHSMGALISYLLTCKLIQKGFAAPQHLFVSGRGYISAEFMRSKVKAQGFEKYLESILGMSSQTEQVLNNDALRKLFLPIFRADVQLCADWQDESVSPIPSPITVFYGDVDTSVTKNSLLAWQQRTNKAFNMKMLPGEHLFVLQQSGPITKEIAIALENYCDEFQYQLSPGFKTAS